MGDCNGVEVRERAGRAANRPVWGRRAVLRRLFLRDRRLLGFPSRCAFRAQRILYKADRGRKDARPGRRRAMVAMATARDEVSPFLKERQKRWARLLHEIFDIEPLRCSRCRVELRVVSVITDPRVMGHILEHVGAGRGTTSRVKRLARRKKPR